jgi:hypothetical protein
MGNPLYNFSQPAPATEIILNVAKKALSYSSLREKSDEAIVQATDSKL